MDKILEAQDILTFARSHIKCVFMAAGQLTREARNRIQVVADTASEKIDEAIALLDEYRHAGDSSPDPAAPSAKPVSRVARMKRAGTHDGEID